MLGAPVVLALLESADANPDDNFAALKGACRACRACTLRCAVSADVLGTVGCEALSTPVCWAGGVGWGGVWPSIDGPMDGAQDAC